LVPASGTATVYIVASYGQIGEQQTQVIGPQDGHPDYDPTFAPFQWYLEELDTLVISATLTNPLTTPTTTFELCHFTLAAGQSTINQSSISSTWKYASAVLNPTGVTAGTYPGATITVSGDGRVTAIASGAYGLLFGPNTWTQPNLFDQPITVIDPNNAGLIVSGAGSLGANILMKGNGVTFPNKWIRVLNGVFQIINNSYGAAILSLDDSGDLVIGGNLTVPLGITSVETIQGAALTATGGVSAGSSVSAGGAVTAGTTVSAGGTVTAGTAVTAASGNVTALNGRLRASYGVSGGDSFTAPILSDFPVTVGANSGSTRLPNGFLRQWGVIINATGTSNVVAFPIPFTETVQFVSATDNGPSCYPYGASPNGLNSFTWFSPTAASHGCYWEAEGI
jgi:hypothetical protein